MKITVLRYGYRGSKCRYCKKSVRWRLRRPGPSTFSSDLRDDLLCNEHLGVALSNLGLYRLDIEQTATCSAEIRP